MQIHICTVKKIVKYFEDFFHDLFALDALNHIITKHGNIS